MKKIFFMIIYLTAILYADLQQITFDSADDWVPKWSYDNSTIAFSRYEGPGIIDIFLVPASGGEPDLLEMDLYGDFHLSWSPDDTQIVFDAYGTGGLNLWIIPVTGGDPEQVTTFGCAHPSWSPDGSQFAVTSTIGGNSNICVFPLNGGSPQQITTNPAEDWHPCWSPDGSNIAFTSNRSGNDDIWIIPASGGNATPVTTNIAHDDRACWSPDGTQIAFESDRNGNFDIYIITINDYSIEQVTFDESMDIMSHWSHDGSELVFSSNRQGSFDVWIVDVIATGSEQSIILTSPKEKLLQNYPNPFNPSTTISLSLKTEITENTELVIYNLIGQKVKSFSNHQIAKSSNHQIVWDGTDQNNQPVSSGIYFSILKEFNKTLASTKMMLLK